MPSARTAFSSRGETRIRSPCVTVGTGRSEPSGYLRRQSRSTTLGLCADREEDVLVVAGQAEPELRAAAGAGSRPDPPAHRPDQSPGDVQADASAGHDAGPVRGPVVEVEQPLGI